MADDFTKRVRHRNGDDNSDKPLSYRGALHILGLVLLLVLAAGIIRAIEPVVLLFAIVLLLAMVLNPVVVSMERRRVPRSVAVGLIFLTVAAVIALIVFIAGPLLVAQLEELGRQAPVAWDAIRSRGQALAVRYPMLQDALPPAEQIAGTIGAKAGGVAAFLLRSTFGIVGAVFSVVFGLLLLVFILSNPQPLVTSYLALVPERYREPARRSLARMISQMSAWARGVVINGGITGTSTGLLLWAVGVQPALVFAVLAFMGEFVPNVGPIIMALPALFVALSMGTTKFFLALAAILFVQQVETNLLVPFVFGREMKLHPVTILFFTLAMGSVFGLAGAVLALPAAALTSILLDEFYLQPRRLNAGALDEQAKELVAGRVKLPDSDK